MIKGMMIMSLTELVAHECKYSDDNNNVINRVSCVCDQSNINNILKFVACVFIIKVIIIISLTE